MINKHGQLSLIGHARNCIGSSCSGIDDKGRASIMLLLNEMAHADDEYHADEQKIIWAVLSLLEIASAEDHNINGQAVMKDIIKNTEILEAVEYLANLSEPQKKDILLWMGCMFQTGGPPDPRSSVIFAETAQRFGFDPDDFYNREALSMMQIVKAILGSSD